MSTLGTNSITTADLRASLDPKGNAAVVYEVLEIASPIVKRGRWMEGNMRSANQTTRQASTETATKRMYERGVAASKTVNVPVIDKCAQYSAFTKVDISKLEEFPSPEKYLAGQERRKIVAMKSDFESDVFYGNAETDPLDINGLATRFSAISTVKGNPGYQVVSAGGSTSLSSLYLIGMGDGGVTFFYPEGSEAGVTRIVDPKALVNDPTDATKQLYAYCVWNNWKVGLAVEDYRQSFLRIANIDTSALATFGSGADTSPDLIGIAIRAMEKLDYKDPTLTYFWAGSETVIGWLKTMYQKTANVNLTLATAQDGIETVRLGGIEVIKSDAILNTESAVS